MRHLSILFAISVLVLTSCGTASTPTPTPLPTAIPPSGDPGEWAISFTHAFESGWGVSAHRYQFLVSCPPVMEEDMATDWVWFDVAEPAQLFPDPVYMRINGLSFGILAPISVEVIHPDQQTVAAVTLVGLAADVAQTASNECQALIRFDDKPPRSLTAGEPFRP